MPQFTVHERRDGEPGYLVNCQHDLLEALSTRFVVPLLPATFGPLASAKLNPSFTVETQKVVLYPQYAGSIEASELGPQVAWLADDRYAILGAIDLLTGGV